MNHIEQHVTYERLLKDFYKKLQQYVTIDFTAGIEQTVKGEPEGIKSIFIYHALENNNPEQEFIIDIEIDFKSKTAVLYHIALPIHMRYKGSGTKIVKEIEKLLVNMEIKYISLPAEHHSTEFWLKMGYRFKYHRECQFYNTNSKRKDLQIAYELEKNLKG